MMFKTPNFRIHLLSQLIPAPFTLIPLKYLMHPLENIAFKDRLAHTNCEFEFIFSKYFQLKAHLSFSEAAASSLYVLFTWFPHGTNCKVFIGRHTCSQRESLQIANHTQVHV